MARRRRAGRPVKIDDSSSQSGTHSLSQHRAFALQIALVGVIGTLVMTVLTCPLEGLGLISTWEHWLQDKRFQNPLLRDPVALDERICFVQVNDDAIERHGPWPWPRDIQAQAVREILEAGAAVVALDLKYHVPRQNPEEDRALASALAGRSDGTGERPSQSVLLAAFVASKDLSVLGDESQRRRLFEELLEAGFPVRAKRQVEAAGLNAEQKQLVETRLPWAVEMLLREQFARRVKTRVAARLPVRANDLNELIPGAPNWVIGIRDRVWRNWVSWSLVAPKDPSPPGASIPKGAPVPVLAGATDGFGMVDAKDDARAAVRRVEVHRHGPTGPLPLLGIAAALEFMKQNSVDASWRIDAEAQEVVFGREDAAWSRLPLEPGEVFRPESEPWDLWIHWPDVGPDGIPPDRLKPIGQFVELAEMRGEGETLEDMKAEALFRLFHVGQGVAEHVNDAELEAVGAGGLDLRALDVDQVTLAQAEGLRGLLERKLTDLPESLQDNTRQCFDYIDHWSLFARAREEIEGKIVFVGVAYGANVDVVQTPLAARTPGVHVHGVVADMVLNGRGVHVSGDWVAWLASILLGLVITALVSWLSLTWSAVGSLALIAGYALWSGAVAFGVGHTLMPMAAPLSTATAVLSVCLFRAYRLIDRERERVTRHFKARVPSDVFALLAQNPETITHKGQKRVCTVLFIDIRGFTQISEKLGAERTVAILNECLRVIAETLLEYKACVNKFLGDGAMAFWSAVDPEPEQERLACQAALACQRKLQDLNDEPLFDGVDPISCRIGIATGPVVVGDVGSEAALSDYTVIGDDVNLAARLESANKAFGSDIVINGTTYRAIRAGKLRTRPIGRIQVVGQRKDVGVHQLLDDSFPAEEEEITRRVVEAFAHGDWDQCRRDLDRLERIEKNYFDGKPEDFRPSGLIQMYRDEMQDREPEKGRVIVLQTK